ncbi:glycosyltransferase family 9 protein [Petrachloros mirabilis]
MVLIHVGSGSRHKCLRPGRLYAVINRIQSAGVSVALLEGPADDEWLSHVVGQHPGRLAIIRGLDLLSVAGLIANVDVFIGHDSGITHLSALVGTRTIALFGPTDPGRWAPCGSHVTVLRGEPCLCPSWDEVSQCSEKSCLNLSVEEVVSTCVTSCQQCANHRNLTRCALSLPTSYARVTS